ncbi:MAG: aminotransferase class III-fold pyridoxal phosphate-dependent enzyme [Candidatus Thermoplasmatota archaeon]|nr:aminotransferase class III-fold pyridoxal phosphate-dependent enzyme [Candidatus Thermoplasmatota archaeon]MCL5889110.1 aminotransferase class III-fold pyridoxal phosphate-dependent enzyme [Candidatus Thermoplasmatota archaeon]
MKKNKAIVIPHSNGNIPGSKSKYLLELQNKYETRTIFYTDTLPIAIDSSQGSIITDVDGNKFIDWMAGISVLNIGFDQEIRNAIEKQLAKTWHALEIPTEARINFLKSLSNSFPSDMKDYRTMFGISGSDAVETAVNISHAVGNPRSTTIAFEGAYHGVSGGIISATAGSKYRRTVYSPGFEMIRVPFPYSLWYDTDVSDIISELRKILLDHESGYNRPDSLLVEPIQGEGGYIVPPKGFLKALREFCDEFELSMIVDEVQSGMGRTGKMWAFEHENITPDIVCISKSVGGGIPLSAIYYRDDYDEKLPKPFHMGTYRANPLAMAAGAYVINKIPSLLERVKRDGEIMKKQFESINSENILEVRGKGFMIGVEMGKDHKPMSQEKMMKLKLKMLRSGLIMHTCGHFGNVFRYMGALNIPEELNEQGMRIFSEVVKGEVK